MKTQLVEVTSLTENGNIAHISSQIDAKLEKELHLSYKTIEKCQSKQFFLSKKVPWLLPRSQGLLFDSTLS